MNVFVNVSELWIFQDCHYAQASEFPGLSLCPGFWISLVTQGLPIFVNVAFFWICVGMQLRKGTEYAMILNISSFSIYNHYTRFWIWLNKARINCSDYGGVIHMSGQSFRILNIPLFLNMPGLRIWPGCEYKRVTEGCEYYYYYYYHYYYYYYYYYYYHYYYYYYYYYYLFIYRGQNYKILLNTIKIALK